MMANARRRTQRATRTSTRSSTSRPTGTGVLAGTLEAEEARMGRTVDWQNEFRYISADLRQLLIVSVILFVLLIAAGFFL
jgi:hypothetical protein